MRYVCLQTLPMTGCHGNEASARYCEKVFFYFTIDFSRSKKVKDTTLSRLRR